MYQKIMLAADGSDNSTRAAREAARLANCSDDSIITIVFVADFDKAKESVLHAESKDSLELTRRKQLKPIEMVLREYDAPYQVQILHGEPAPVLINYAHTESFDLVVIGSRGLNSFQEMILGSVSHKVMKRLSCPVLLVK
ncbi:universal stress protein [Sporosarcina sp. BI001-red]|uniref:universal stress protein n=1 Tax=Sporosarcina sp. BI001-red TaxID=2282866 RepID=UPI000E2573B2|nr:universal stress protein [Sporosarcina sp. BI001-red]REB07966.1 universal stress protein [Sporosarcina sp. BI001-red]